MTLLFQVNNQNLSLNPGQSNVKVVADSRNYLKAQFMFQTNDWKKGDLLYALFTHNGRTYKKFLGIEEGVKWNECYIAPEVIKEGKFSVSVFNNDLITTNTVDIPVQKSGYTENIENQKTTPSVVEQMNEMMYQYAKLCNDIYEECKKTAGGNK
jgi:hypothetical protein